MNIQKLYDWAKNNNALDAEIVCSNYIFSDSMEEYRFEVFEKPCILTNDEMYTKTQEIFPEKEIPSNKIIYMSNRVL